MKAQVEKGLAIVSNLSIALGTGNTIGDKAIKVAMNGDMGIMAMEVEVARTDAEEAALVED